MQTFSVVHTHRSGLAFFSLVPFILLALLTGCAEKPSVVGKHGDDPAHDQGHHTRHAASTALLNAHLITMVDERILPNQTLVIEGGLITAAGSPHEVNIPAGAKVIDLQGQYVMPGLADMHVHFLCNKKRQDCESAKQQAKTLLAYGVTSALSIIDTYGVDTNIVRERLAKAVAEGELPGPTIYTTSFANGNDKTLEEIPRDQIITTPKEAREFVARSKAQAYDVVKIFDMVTPDTFRALAEATEQHQLPLVGHLPGGTTVETLLTEGMDMVVHSAAFHWRFFGFGHHQHRIPEAIEMLNSNRGWVTTSLAVESLIPQLACANEAEMAKLLNAPEAAYLSPYEKDFYWGELFRIITFPQDRECKPEDFAKGFRSIQQHTQAFYKGGVKFVAGTDTPLFLVNGVSMHQELEQIQALGLSPFQTLEIATANASDFIRQFHSQATPFGRLQVGHRADLIVLPDNPLEDLAHIKQRSAVMAQGRWYPASELDNMLEEVAEHYKKSATVKPVEDEHPIEKQAL